MAMGNDDKIRAALRPEGNPAPPIQPLPPVEEPWPDREQQKALVPMVTAEPEPTPENLESQADLAKITQLKNKNGWPT